MIVTKSFVRGSWGGGLPIASRVGKRPSGCKSHYLRIKFLLSAITEVANMSFVMPRTTTNHVRHHFLIPPF